MSGTSSSCHPARLERFGQTLHTLCDGLSRRARILDDALADYRAQCEHDYRAPTVGLGSSVRALVSELRDLGRWTLGVGDAFAQAALVNEYMAPGTTGTDLEAVLTVRDGQLVGYLTQWPDPYRGVPEGAATHIAAALHQRYDQDEPPAWIAELSQSGTVSDAIWPLLKEASPLVAKLPSTVSVTLSLETGERVGLADGATATRLTRTEVVARLRLPEADAGRLLTASKWVGRAGVAATGLAAAGGQWVADDGLPVPQRAARTTGRGVAVGLGAWAGAAAGAGIGELCGPAAIVCSPPLAVGGGIVGTAAADKVADWLLEPSGPKPAGRDLGDLRKYIAAEDGTATPALEARADRVASHLARASTADQPVLASRVESLVPDDASLRRVMAADDWTAARPPQSPAAVLSASPPRDPWGGDHPWL